jgi:L-asparaginase
VLLVYTGGTIGSAPSDVYDRLSPRVVKPWPYLRHAVPAFSGSTPESLNFPIDCVAFERPLDSSNIAPRDWGAMANLLKTFMESYEGFVIAHGTDTMVYSASALSFMLSGLRKPVILTGSQLSAIGHVRNDAQQNLVTALLIANSSYSRIPQVHEVCIFFGNRLLRGNRAIKQDADGFDAYVTPNYPPLGEAGGTILIRTELLRQEDDEPFRVHENIDTNVIDVTVFPGIQDRGILGSILQTPGLKGVVLRTYGAGNMATKRKFLNQLRIAAERAIVVVNVSQCARGAVRMGLYETSALLMEYGVVSGGDITAEAALTKLMVLLGDQSLDRGDVARLVQVSTRGELSESRYVYPLDLPTPGVVSGASPSLRFQTQGNVAKPAGEIRQAALVLHSATVVPVEGSDRVVVDIFVNDQPGSALTAAKMATRDGERATLVFTITDAVRAHLEPNRKNSFCVALGAGVQGRLRWESGELAISTRE